MDELNRKLQESYRKQRIANRIGIVAAVGSMISTAILIIYQISCL